MLKQLKTELDYFDGKHLMEANAVRIGASSLYKYLYKTREFFGDLLLDEKNFKGNTATVTGTCVHYILEQYAKTNTFSTEARTELENYVKKVSSIEYEDFIEGVDPYQVKEQYKPMAEAVINDYLKLNKPTFAEAFVTHQTDVAYDDSPIYIGGTIDGLILENPVYEQHADPSLDTLVSATGGTIVDYKTKNVYSSYLPKQGDKMDIAYKMQLLVYAYILRKKNIIIDRIRLVYVSKNETGRISEKTGKPLTDYPSKVSVQTEMITQEDMEFIESIIFLVTDAVKLWKSNPELRYLLAHDYRLKNK